jgi:hypothetical protein
MNLLLAVWLSATIQASAGDMTYAEVERLYMSGKDAPAAAREGFAAKNLVGRWDLRLVASPAGTFSKEKVLFSEKPLTTWNYWQGTNASCLEFSASAAETGFASATIYKGQHRHLDPYVHKGGFYHPSSASWTVDANDPLNFGVTTDDRVDYKWTYSCRLLSGKAGASDRLLCRLKVMQYDLINHDVFDGFVGFFRAAD